MHTENRSAFQQQVVEALIQSKAINLEAVGATFSKYGERAVLQGESLVQIVNRHVFWACGWPGPELDIMRNARQLSE